VIVDRSQGTVRFLTSSAPTFPTTMTTTKSKNESKEEKKKEREDYEKPPPTITQESTNPSIVHPSMESPPMKSLKETKSADSSVMSAPAAKKPRRGLARLLFGSGVTQTEEQPFPSATTTTTSSSPHKMTV
jgi:hypothetical protein